MRTETRQRLETLLVTDGLPSLGAEKRPGVRSVAELEGEMGAVFRDCPEDEPARDLARALILLWHDHLDESHSVSQNIHTPDGSHVHGIMHRRVPDYSNARYWFHRVGDRPVFVALAAAAKVQADMRRLSSDQLGRLVPSPLRWDPFAFIDAIEAAPRSPALVSLQAAEIAGLLEHALSR